MQAYARLRNFAQRCVDFGRSHAQPRWYCLLCCVRAACVEDYGNRWNGNLVFCDSKEEEQLQGAGAKPSKQLRGKPYEHNEGGMQKALRCALQSFYDIQQLHRQYVTNRQSAKKSIQYKHLNDFAKYEVKYYQCDGEDEKWDLTIHTYYPSISRRYVNPIKWKGHQYRCAANEDRRQVHKSYQSYFRVENWALDDTMAAAVEDGYRYGRILYFVKIMIADHPMYFAAVHIYHKPTICQYSNEPIIDTSTCLMEHKYVAIKFIDAPVMLAPRIQLRPDTENNNKLTAFPIEHSYYALVAASTSPDF